MPETFAENRAADTGSDAAKAPIIIAQKIRLAILDGTYQPGARLTEVELAEKFKVSRSPVREALQGLVSEGTLTAAPYRRAIVKPLSPEEGLEIAELRLALISLAVRPAYPHLSPADFELAERIARRMNRTNDPVQFFEEAVRFWHIIFEKAQRPILLEVFEQLERRTTRYIPLIVRLFPDSGKRPQQREVFLSLYRKGKVTEALQAFRKVYLKQVHMAIDHLRSQPAMRARRPKHYSLSRSVAESRLE
jgi:DNA-binding GntR family transcriptional regulator